MAVYRLDPRLTGSDNPRWAASSIREAVFAGADTPTEARALVATVTVNFVTVKPGQPKPLSPWFDDALTSCVWETQVDAIGEGEVRTVAGRELP